MPVPTRPTFDVVLAIARRADWVCGYSVNGVNASGVFTYAPKTYEQLRSLICVAMRRGYR
jgi:hypothetical protein